MYLYLNVNKWCTMKVGRRKLLAGLGVSASAFGLAAVVDGGRSQSVHVDLSANVPSEKPLVKNETLSVDSGPAHLNYYKVLVSSRDELRWDLFAEDPTLRMFVDDFEETDWDSQLLVIFGMVLPRTKDFQPVDDTTLEDGTLTVPLALDDRPSSSTEAVIMNYIERVDLDEKPHDLAVSVTY